MIRGYYAARSGLINHQEHMNTLANNLANANTPGFKPMRTTFTDMMYQNLNRPGADSPAQVGHGVQISKNDILMNMGPLQPTDRLFDLALENENYFFAVETPDGEIQYTRAGNFYLGNDDGTYYLVDGAGNYVLGRDEDWIEINTEYDEDDEEEMFNAQEMVGVFYIANPYAMLATGGTNFLETEQSGIPDLVEDPTILTSFLEGSGVQIATEMVQVIEATKAFSLNSRMIQVADEVEQTINNLR